MKKETSILILTATILLGGFIRFYHLGNVGIGFFRDEAAMGLNSWSILKTGVDEYGHFMPLFFRSFEVFFMPAYVYLSVPIFWLFGLSFFSARTLAALSGTLLIPVAYLIGKEFFKSEKVGLICAFIISITPWSIFYSRGAFEGNLALLFFASGFYLWIKFLNTERNKLFFLSLFFFILSMYSYQAPRFVAPFFIALSIIFNKNWIKKIRLWILGGLFALLLYLPILIFTTQPAGYHRAIGVSIFTSNQPVPGYNSNLGKWQYLYLVPREVASLYLQYFSPNNLVSQSDYNPQRRVPNYSVFYIWMLPLLIIGLVDLINNDYKNKKTLFLWLFISPLPAALTLDPFHTYRAILFWFPISILISLGVYKLFNYFKKYRAAILSGILLLCCFSVSSYLFNLFKVAPVIAWRDWDYGYKEISDYIKSQPIDIRVVIDDPNTESYIHFLFNGVIPIKEYQKAASAIIGKNYYQSSDELRPQEVGRFEFKKVDWPSERGDKNTLFIFPSNRLFPSEFATDPKLSWVKTIYAPSGEPAFYLVKSLN